MKDVNIFSGIKHILSQRALPYHSYISTSKNKSNFHLKFSIWGRNYRTDDHQNFLQILNLSLDWYMLFLVVTDTSFSPPLKKKNRKKICRDMSDWITHSESMSTGQNFSIMSTSFTRLHYVVETKFPEARISVAQNATIFRRPDCVKILFFTY